MARLAQPGDRLDPAKRFLDALAQALADPIADMARRAAIDGGPPPGRVLGDVWCDPDRAQPGHVLGGVVGLVRAQRRPAPACGRLDHRLGRLALGPAGRMRGSGIDDQPWRFSISKWPMKHRRDGEPFDLR